MVQNAKYGFACSIYVVFSVRFCPYPWGTKTIPQAVSLRAFSYFGFEKKPKLKESPSSSFETLSMNWSGFPTTFP
jgi:hypothetical protein